MSQMTIQKRTVRSAREMFWMQIEAAYKTEDEWALILNAVGVHVLPEADFVIKSRGFSSLCRSVIPLNLAAARLDMLFESIPATHEIWSYIPSIGGRICPSEAVLAVAVHLSRRPTYRGIDLWFVMNQRLDSASDPCILRIFGDDHGRLCLQAEVARPWDKWWDMNRKIVFGCDQLLRCVG